MTNQDKPEEEKYKAAVYCKNCRAKQEVEIPKGTTVYDFVLKHNICLVCGCDMLRRKISDIRQGPDTLNGQDAWRWLKAIISLAISLLFVVLLFWQLKWIASIPLIRYLFGYSFSVVAGWLLIALIVRKMHDRVDEEVAKQYPGLPRHGIRPFRWFPAEFGLVERALYTSSWLLGRPEFIGIWLIVKIGARWTLPKDRKDSRHRYYPVLLGTALSVGYGVVGAIVIQWLHWQFYQYHVKVLITTVMGGTWLLIAYELWLQKALEKRFTRKTNN